MRKLLVSSMIALSVGCAASGAGAAGAPTADQKPPVPIAEKAKPAAPGLLSKPTATPEAAAPAAAASAPQIPSFDVAVLATGIRASRVMGKAVRNEAGEDIGTVNDLIINPPDNVAYAIIGVGGFLGVGERLVAVPFDALLPRDAGNGLALPGATKDSIKLLPEFKYPPRPERPLN